MLAPVAAAAQTAEPPAVSGAIDFGVRGTVCPATARATNAIAISARSGSGGRAAQPRAPRLVVRFPGRSCRPERSAVSRRHRPSGQGQSLAAMGSDPDADEPDDADAVQRYVPRRARNRQRAAGAGAGDTGRDHRCFRRERGSVRDEIAAPHLRHRLRVPGDVGADGEGPGSADRSRRHAAVRRQFRPQQRRRARGADSAHDDRRRRVGGVRPRSPAAASRIRRIVVSQRRHERHVRQSRSGRWTSARHRRAGG